MIDAVSSIPVVAAGDIAGGRGLAAVLLLGTVGGGWARALSPATKWGGGAWEQRAVLAASADDTVQTSVFDQVRGAPFPASIADRVLRNAFTGAWDGRDKELAARRTDLLEQIRAAAQTQDASAVDISAGVSASLLHHPHGYCIGHCYKYLTFWIKYIKIPAITTTVILSSSVMRLASAQCAPAAS